MAPRVPSSSPASSASRCVRADPEAEDHQVGPHGTRRGEHPAVLEALDRLPEAGLDAQAPHRVDQPVAHVRVELAGHGARRGLEQGHPRPPAVEGLGHLQADEPGARPPPRRGTRGCGPRPAGRCRRRGSGRRGRGGSRSRAGRAGWGGRRCRSSAGRSPGGRCARAPGCAPRRCAGRGRCPSPRAGCARRCGAPGGTARGCGRPGRRASPRLRRRGTGCRRPSSWCGVPRSRATMSRPGSSRRAWEAAAMPAASPPMTTSLSAMGGGYRQAPTSPAAGLRTACHDRAVPLPPLPP